MNIRISFSLLLALLLTTLFVTTQPSSAVAPQKGPQAFGEGQYRLPGQGVQINFSFDAAANEKGKAHGQAQFTFTRAGSQSDVTIRINCLNAVDPTAANIGGVVQHSNDPGYPKHSAVFFVVIDKDNFPVPTSNPDQITPLIELSPDPKDVRCDLFPLTLLNLEFGDIAIEP